jgi:hypothetical protein
MSSVRSLIRLWIGFTLLIFGYAACDRMLNPWLRFEQSFSLEPDISRLPDLMHWGGRLMHQHWMLFVCNAIVVGGLAALSVQSIVQLFAGRSRGSLPERINVLPPPPRPSTPPSA